MSLLVDLYDSRSLSQAINKVAATEPFLLNKIFYTKEQHDSDKVDIEIVAGSSKVAQFVNANEPNPTPASKLTKTMTTITIPRTYESKVFTAQMLKDMNVAGGIYATAQERAKAQQEKVAMELADLKDRVIRVREKMAADAISTGAIAVSQDNIKFGVSFGFVTSASGNIRTLTGADLWSATTGVPLANVRAWKNFIMKSSFQNANICILGTSAAEAFVGNENVRKAFDANNFMVGRVDLTQDGTVGATYLGRLLGIDFYEYAQQYIPDGGSATDLIPTDRAILVAAGTTNRLHYGPAYRINGNAVQVFNGEFLLEIDDKSSKTMLQWNCEQKSLPAIHDPGCVVSVKVV